MVVYKNDRNVFVVYTEIFLFLLLFIVYVGRKRMHDILNTETKHTNN